MLSKKNNFKTKKELDGSFIRIKNNFTYYPLYDIHKNSFIKRYQLWTKYRDECIKNNRKYVSCKDYAKILKKMGERVQNCILEDPNGVNFGPFTLKQSFKKSKNFESKVLMKSKKNPSGTLKLGSWDFRPIDSHSEKIYKRLKDNKISEYDYTVNDFKILNISLEKQLDIFNDF